MLFCEGVAEVKDGSGSLAAKEKTEAVVRHKAVKERETGGETDTQ